MKQYKFDYLKEMVDEWVDKTHVTRQQLDMLPFRVSLPYLDFKTYIPSKDYYGEVIENFEEWDRQRDEYLDKLWIELGSYKDNII